MGASSAQLEKVLFDSLILLLNTFERIWEQFKAAAFAKVLHEPNCVMTDVAVNCWQDDTRGLKEQRL